MKRQLSQMEEKREIFANKSHCEQMEVEELIKEAKDAETVPVPLSEVLRMKGMEVSFRKHNLSYVWLILFHSCPG